MALAVIVGVAFALGCAQVWSRRTVLEYAGLGGGVWSSRRTEHVSARPVRFAQTNRFSPSPTPCLSIDLERVRENYRNVMTIFGDRLEIFYAVKANNDPAILTALYGEGSSFDVASLSEIRAAMAIGCPPDRLAFSNPIKAPAEIKAAHQLGVRLFCADSESEIEKLSELAPGSDVYIRLAVSNKGSVWPLTGKFGVEQHEARHLLVGAKRAGLNPVGLTFHVGSQCLNPENWYAAIDTCAEIFKACENDGIHLTLLNLGGGLPALERMTAPPRIEEIGKGIMAHIDRGFRPEVRVLMEPGRHMVATAGTLVATVIGDANRRGERWIYLDVGIYNGLMEIHEGFPYEVRTANPGREPQAYVVAGPTCDCVDVIFRDIMLPRVAVGDQIYFMNAGAYTTGYDRYNGFDFPVVVVEQPAISECERGARRGAHVTGSPTCGASAVSP